MFKSPSIFSGFPAGSVTLRKRRSRPSRTVTSVTQLLVTLFFGHILAQSVSTKRRGGHATTGDFIFLAFLAQCVFTRINAAALIRAASAALIRGRRLFKDCA